MTWRNLRRYKRQKWLRYQLFGTARPITRKELEALRRALNWRDGLSCSIMADTGLRVSDVLALRRDQLAQTMTIREIKTGKIRTVHLSAETYDECCAYLRTTDSDKVIDCHRSTLWRAITGAADAYGWTHVSPHSLRKLYACEYCARYGLQATQKELQHKSLETTLRYLGDYKELLTALAAAVNHEGSRTEGAGKSAAKRRVPTTATNRRQKYSRRGK